VVDEYSGIDPIDAREGFAVAIDDGFVEKQCIG
jgi:hypothetical protein